MYIKYFFLPIHSIASSTARSSKSPDSNKAYSYSFLSACKLGKIVTGASKSDKKTLEGEKKNSHQIFLGKINFQTFLWEKNQADFALICRI
jgi:hypothetical protein